MTSTLRYGKKADLALSLWVKLARASASFGRLTARDIDQYGVTQPQFSVLETLGHLGPMQLGELCKKMLVTGGNMTVVVDNLEKEGLVARSPSKKDRRAIVVALTPKGRDLFRRIFPQHAAFVTRMTSVLSESEQEALSALLKKLGTSCRKHLLA